MKHSRKLKLSPEQNEILQNLEEAGGEDLACILNTLWAKTAIKDPGLFLQRFEANALALIRLGLVAFYKSEANVPFIAVPRDEMLAALPLNELVQFAPFADHWLRLPELSGERLEGLMLTEAGVTEMRR